jgi:hypothetical protein
MMQLVLARELNVGKRATVMLSGLKRTSGESSPISAPDPNRETDGQFCSAAHTSARAAKRSHPRRVNTREEFAGLMLDIRPKQVWEEIISAGQKRRFIVLSVWEDVVEILEDHSSRRPHNSWIDRRDLFRQPEKYRLVDEGE